MFVFWIVDLLSVWKQTTVSPNKVYKFDQALHESR